MAMTSSSSLSDVAVLVGRQQPRDQPVVGTARTPRRRQPGSNTAYSFRAVGIVRSASTPDPLPSRMTNRSIRTWNSSRSSSPTPSMVEITDSGQRRGRSRPPGRPSRCPVARAFVDEVAHDPLDVPRHLLHHAGREGLVDQPSQTGMVRVVLVDHGIGQQPEHLGQVPHHQTGTAARRVAREAHVVVQQQHVLVPGQHESGATHELLGIGRRHRTTPPQLRVAWERICEHEAEVGQVRAPCRSYRPLHLGLKAPDT